jgi:hypothetical protein
LDDGSVYKKYIWRQKSDFTVRATLSEVFSALAFFSENGFKNDDEENSPNTHDQEYFGRDLFDCVHIVESGYNLI